MLYILLAIFSAFCSGTFYFIYKNLSPNNIVLLIFAIACLGLFIIFLILALYFYQKSKIKELQKQINAWGNTTYHLAEIGDDVFLNLPVGILVYDEDYKIKWANSYFKGLINKKIDDQSLSSIDDKLLEFVKNKKDHIRKIKIGSQTFEMQNKFDMSAIYFFDITAKEELQSRYDNRVCALGYIYIDHLEESIKNFDLQVQTEVRGKILGELVNWAKEYNAFFQNVDEDKIFIVSNRQNLDKMVESKFDILEKIDQISKEYHLSTTISIGFASHDLESNDLGKVALQAVELAEKRGGAQAVINIKDTSIKYFGGNTNAAERQTYGEVRFQTQTLKELASSASNIIIMAHNMADCDAFGAMIGVYKFLLPSYSNVKIVISKAKLEPTAARLYEMLINNQPEIASTFISEEEAKASLYDSSLLIICDTQSPKIAMFPDLCDLAKQVAVIDHHRAGAVGFKNVKMSYVETYASSTVELVTEFFPFDSAAKLTPLEATIMLAGVVVDTNNFTFRANFRTFDVASTLRQAQADMITVRKILRDSYTYEKELAEAVVNAKIYYDRYALSILPFEITDRTFLAKVADRLLTIEDIDASFAIAKMKDINQIAISSRSLDNVNVQRIMEEMGGGGHLNSAAVQINDTPIEKVTDQLLQLIKEDDLENRKEEQKMKVILTCDVKGKGAKDTEIEVNNGYGNYLINNNMAILATEENKKQVEADLKEAEQKRKEHLIQLEKLKTEIEKKSVTIVLKTGVDGKAFGQITSKQICDEFEAQNGIKLDKRKLDLKGDINSVGIYTVKITLDKGIEASFSVNVIGNTGA